LHKKFSNLFVLTGNIAIFSGESERSDGGNITAMAGVTSADAKVGGSIDVVGGAGTSNMIYNGGNGGNA